MTRRVVLAAVCAAAAAAGAAGEGRMRQERRVVPAGGASVEPRSQAVVAGGLVYVSGLVAVDAAGRPAGGGVAAETRQAIGQLDGVLAAAGSSLASAVKVNVYLRRAEDFDAMNAVYREFFAEAPPARTTIVADLPGAAAVGLSAVAAAAGTPRDVLHPAGWVRSARPYSYIVRAGDLVFLAGLVSRRGSDDQIVPGSTGTQVKTILDNAAVLLKTAGLSLADVVSSRVFIRDGSLFEAMNDEYRKYFAKEPPARATAVADLMNPGFLVEITLVASAAPKVVLGSSVAPSLPLSPAVRAGGHVFLSGVLGHTDANVNDPGGQTRETLTRIGRTLETAGLTFADVVDSTVYLPSLRHAPAVDAVYREFFPSDPPARATVGAGLVTRAGLVEIMLTAWAGTAPGE